MSFQIFSDSLNVKWENNFFTFGGKIWAVARGTSGPRVPPPLVCGEPPLRSQVMDELSADEKYLLV